MNRTSAHESASCMPSQAETHNLLPHVYAHALHKACLLLPQAHKKSAFIAASALVCVRASACAVIIAVYFPGGIAQPSALACLYE